MLKVILPNQDKNKGIIFLPLLAGKHFSGKFPVRKLRHFHVQNLKWGNNGINSTNKHHISI